MITGRDFVVLSDDWHGMPTSTIHLFRHISKTSRVFWFHVVNRLPNFTREDIGKVMLTFGHSLGLMGNAKKCAATDDESRVIVTTPFIVPWFKRPVRSFNAFSLHQSFQRLSKKHGIYNPIVVTTWPSTVDFITQLNASPTIYCCVDEWTDYPGLNSADFARMENSLLDNIDGFVATSRELLTKSRSNTASLYLPHGVDVDHFCKESFSRVAVMEKIRRPIVGFFGHIAEWIDVDIIKRLATRFSEVSFVLLGASTIDMSWTAQFANIHYLGRVPYAELPNYARYFDVGLIPFVRNKLTEAVNPLKLMEYYALGLPVLATRLPEMESAAGPIFLGSNIDDFSKAVEKILQKVESFREDALVVARANTWESRSREFMTYLAALC
jgi:hypothetical protein